MRGLEPFGCYLQGLWRWEECRPVGPGHQLSGWPKPSSRRGPQDRKGGRAVLGHKHADAYAKIRMPRRCTDLAGSFTFDDEVVGAALPGTCRSRPGSLFVSRAAIQPHRRWPSYQPSLRQSARPISSLPWQKLRGMTPSLPQPPPLPLSHGPFPPGGLRSPVLAAACLLANHCRQPYMHKGSGHSRCPFSSSSARPAYPGLGLGLARTSPPVWPHVAAAQTRCLQLPTCFWACKR